MPDTKTEAAKRKPGRKQRYCIVWFTGGEEVNTLIYRPDGEVRTYPIDGVDPRAGEVMTMEEYAAWLNSNPGYRGQGGPVVVVEDYYEMLDQLAKKDGRKLLVPVPVATRLFGKGTVFAE